MGWLLSSVYTAMVERFPPTIAICHMMTIVEILPAVDSVEFKVSIRKVQ